MNNQDELKELSNKVMDELANKVSMILRSLDNKNLRLEALKKMETKPSINILERIYKIALEKEDYETCEAINEYYSEIGIDRKK